MKNAQNRDELGVTCTHDSTATIPQKPSAPDVNFPQIPDALTALKNFLMWRYMPGKTKWSKEPYQTNGYRASTTNPSTHTTLDKARAAYEDETLNFDGIGIVLRDGLCGIDLDQVVIPDGTIKPWAEKILTRFAGTYIERSPGGDGFHILCYGVAAHCGRPGPEGKLEIYDQTSARYFTLTGQRYSQIDNITEQQDALDWLGDAYPDKSLATEKKEKARLSVVPPAMPSPVSTTPDLSDAELIRRGNHSTKFATLFSGEWSAYDSQSEGDQALTNLIAFYAGNNPAQIDRVFKQSGLYRDKWDKPHEADGSTYGQMTIRTALAGTSVPDGQRAREEHARASSASAVQTKPATPGFQFIRAGDLLAKPKPIPWLIKGMFEQAGLLQLIGASGSAKTFMVIDWASCIATGREWNGNPVSQGAVFYIAGEGHAGFNRRLRAWEMENETSLADAPIYVSTMPASLMNVANAQAVATAVDAMADQYGVEPKLIVIDTFARNLGTGDENNNADVSSFINNIDVHLRARFNAAVLIVHHTGHQEAQRGRGASAMRAAMDSEYLLSVNGDYRSLACTKSKETELGEPIDFKLKEVALDGWTDEDGVLMTSAVIVRAEESAPKAKGKSKPRLKGPNKIALDALMQAMQDHGTEPSPELMANVGDMLAPKKVVLIDQWRDRAYTSSISTEGPDAKRMAFIRACKALRDTGFVEIWNDECWSSGSVS